MLLAYQHGHLVVSGSLAQMLEPVKTSDSRVVDHVDALRRHLFDATPVL
jgi:hypothetical protein